MKNEAADAKPNRHTKRKLELRNRMLEAAIELFETQGVEQTSAAQICREADVARKTFFNHFTSKQQLIREIAAAQIPAVVLNLEEAAKLDASTPDRISAYFARIARYGEESRPATRELIGEFVRAMSDVESDQSQRVRPAFQQLIEECINYGDTTTTQDAETLTEVVMGSFYVLWTSWAHNEDYDLAARCMAVSDCIVELLCGPQKSKRRKSAKKKATRKGTN